MGEESMSIKKKAVSVLPCNKPKASFNIAIRKSISLIKLMKILIKYFNEDFFRFFADYFNQFLQ
jgi:hypothetical protein